ncbi:MAG: anaerobic ribonucleoside-triphosphate reductase activating protein [Promethearchaeota archaeon]
MRVGGIIDISTKDVPSKTSMVIFSVGCNLNCSFCHNKNLLNPKVGRNMKINEILNHVKSNVLVSWVSISGGEPTLQKELIELCQEIHKNGKLINIDTNGTNPSVIKKLLPYINRISLDLKASPNKKIYERVVNCKIDIDPILETFKLVNNQNTIEFEIRTTYVENLLTTKDIHKIITFLKKNRFRGNFVLQQYQYSEGVGEKYKEIYNIPEHLVLLKILKKYKNKKTRFSIFLRDNVVGYKNINDIENNWN